MNIQEFPVLSREDLKPQYKDVSIEKIIKNGFNAFMSSISSQMYRFNIIFFIDNNGDIFVVKNKYGKNSREYLDYLLTQLEIYTNRTINAEKLITDISGSNWWQFFSIRKKCGKFIRDILGNKSHNF